MAKILVIDDYADLRALVKRILERDGHKVTIAESGRIAANRIEDEDLASTFDVIISDIAMPSDEGIETIELLKQANPKAKLIAMSGGDHSAAPDADLQMARRMGANLTIAKPFSVAELFAAMQSLLATP